MTTLINLNNLRPITACQDNKQLISFFGGGFKESANHIKHIYKIQNNHDLKINF